MPSGPVRPLHVLLRGVAAVYVIAFASLGSQILGLCGSQGILPAARWLDFFSQQSSGFSRYLMHPTVFWLSAGDAWLVGGCILGIAAALFAAFGFFPRVFFAAAGLLYLSYYTVCGPFLHFQWDLLLLEAGFLAVWAAPFKSYSAPASRPALWMYRFLLFKLMLFSGLCKLTSHDPAWSTLNALHFHYWTQPLPPWTAWFFDRLPDLVQRLSVLIMFGIELILPWGIWCGRRARRAALTGFLILQSLIFISGNFGFFNILSAVFCVSLLEEPAAPKRSGPLLQPGRAWKAPLVLSLCVLNIFISVYLGAARWVADAPRIAWVDQYILRPLQSWPVIGTYGLFSVMTTERREIVIEGSNDGEEWREYEFCWKPGDPAARPRFAAPHMPRLDWQMWFAALGTWRENPWFLQLCQRILEGSKPVLKLLKRDPFDGVPPRYLRATLYTYAFARELPFKSRVWWTRRVSNAYCPMLSLKSV